MKCSAAAVQAPLLPPGTVLIVINSARSGFGIYVSGGEVGAQRHMVSVQMRFEVLSNHAPGDLKKTFTLLRFLLFLLIFFFFFKLSRNKQDSACQSATFQNQV